METFFYYAPIALIVLSNIFYHICSKSSPQNLNPLAALTVTYTVGAVFSAVLFFLTSKGGNLFKEYKNINWTTFVLGLAIVGLEVGTLYMYKAGWNISTGQLVHSSILAVALLVIGLVFYKESLNLSKIMGIVICMVGLFFINKP
ncbi:MAG: EamA family transporter [Clostridiales bacterium]|nr:EamA family transporter [Candidatus Equinaster intestinalis]